MSCYHAAWTLGELGDEAQKALVKFGTVCIPEVIKKVEYRIANPVKEGRG